MKKTMKLMCILLTVILLLSCMGTNASADESGGVTGYLERDAAGKDIMYRYLDGTPVDGSRNEPFVDGTIRNDETTQLWSERLLHYDLVDLTPQEIADVLDGEYDASRNTIVVRTGNTDLYPTEPTMEEVAAVVKSVGDSGLKYNDAWDVKPMTKAPFTVGDLKDVVKKNVLDYANSYKFIAKRPYKTWDEGGWNDKFAQSMQAYAQVMGYHNTQAHELPIPAGMTSPVNDTSIASNATTDAISMDAALKANIDNMIQDHGSPSNLVNQGHRWVQFGGDMFSIGGCAGTQNNTIYTSAGSTKSDEIKKLNKYGLAFGRITAWPPSGYVPTSYVQTNTSWGIALPLGYGLYDGLHDECYSNGAFYKSVEDAEKYPASWLTTTKWLPEKHLTNRNSLKITVTRKNDGKVWTFDGSTPRVGQSNNGDYVEINSKSMDAGGADITLILGSRSLGGAFNPMPEGTYVLHFSGLTRNGKPAPDLEYTTTFFNVDNVKSPCDLGDHQWSDWAPTGKGTEEKRVCEICHKSETRDPDMKFTDVHAKDYFYESVKWASKNGVAAGTGKNTFSPNMDCTRGQTVTFLWRAAGSPEPATSVNPFRDVKPSDYFYKAVLWAAENGVTAGTSKTTFSPNAKVTRGQFVTFLYRYQGSPDASSYANPFTDVGKSYYTDAVKWASSNGIAAGTGKGKFSPEATCTRAQTVTFLYRALSSKK